MKKKRVEHKSSGVICDNENCDYSVPNVPMKGIPKYLNVECPKCGEILLTQNDLDSYNVLTSTTDLINNLDDNLYEGLLDEFKSESNEQSILAKITTHNGFNFEILDDEDNNNNKD